MNRSCLHRTRSCARIGKFADGPQPSLLWHKGGRFRELLELLGSRFLGAPDSVLDQEGIHAKWKWLEQGRRALKFKLMNAMMSVREYVHFFGSLPEFQDLRPHIYLAHAAKAAQYKALRTAIGSV